MKIYFDHAATTKVDPKVKKAMEPYFNAKFGNPSSLYSWGQEAKIAIEESRGKIASILGCESKEIIFTSCATESNNLAIKGIAWACKLKGAGSHIITSSTEHHCVLDACKFLERLHGFEVTYLPVDKNGMVNPSDVKKAIKDTTVLISIMHANNEVGTIQPIKEIGGLIRNINKKRKNKVYFHTDAVQSFQYLKIDVNDLSVDSLSLTGHKFYAPKGIGVLYLKKGTPLIPQQQGGAQERNLRAGTENVPYIVGIAKAAELASQIRDKESTKLTKLRDKLTKEVLKNIPDVILTGHLEERLPHIASFCVRGIEGESMLINLDLKRIAVSTGSACTSGSLQPSHVLKAMGISQKLIHGSLRISLGRESTKEDIDYFMKVFPEIVKKLRKVSPVK